jgi:hypothetical protein
MRFRSVREEILDAHSVEGVERVLFDALGRIEPDELKTLPEECLAIVANRRTDIHETAVTLLHCDLRHRGEGLMAELLRQLAELYASASVRISQIEHRRPRP